MKNQEALEEAAQKAVAKLGVTDIADMVRDTVLGLKKEHDDFFSAVDPDYLTSQEQRERLYNRVKGELTDEGKEALRKYAIVSLDESVTREVAWFWLGYFSAMKFAPRAK